MSINRVERITAVLLLMGLFYTGVPGAATWYVDYDNGNDANTGTAAGSAWKHCPGDSAAAAGSTAALYRPQPGDIFLFRGGVVYHGSIVAGTSGSSNQCITYKGDVWPTGNVAVIEGTMAPSLNWRACTAEMCHGNPNWTNIVYADLGISLSPFTQFFDNGQRMYLAQTPNMSDPFWDDHYSEYFPVSVVNLSTESIRDQNVFTQSTTNYWDGAYVQVWRRPNVIGTLKVTRFVPATNTIYFTPMSADSIYGDRDQYYSMVNHISALDRPGEYIIDESMNRIFYWPYGDIRGSTVSASVHANGFDVNGQSYLALEGLHFRGYSGDARASAIVNNHTWEPVASSITVRNCEISWVRARDGRKGAVEFCNTQNLLIENCFVHHNPRNSGINLGSSYTIVRNNTIHKVGYKGIWFVGTEGRILNNVIDEINGTHGTPVSIFASVNVIMANNLVFARGEGVSFDCFCKNLVFYNNIVLSSSQGNPVFRQNTPDAERHEGYLLVANNVVLYSGSTHCAMGIIGPSANVEPDKIIVKNNIADGWSSTSVLYTQTSHNIYTGLSWSMTADRGWYLMPGELVRTDLNSIFVNPAQNDYRLAANSPARAAGVNLEETLPQELKDIFPILTGAGTTAVIHVLIPARGISEHIK
jgi:hypothetical protein